MKFTRSSSCFPCSARRAVFTVPLLIAAASAGLALAGCGRSTAIAAPKDFFSGPVLKNADARAQCAAAVLPGANVIYFNDAKTMHATAFYQAAQARAAKLPKTPPGPDADKAEKMQPFLDVLKKDLSLVIATCDARQLNFSGAKQDPTKFPFVAALAIDRALTAADVNTLILKSSDKPGKIEDYNGFQILTDPNPGTGPVFTIGLAPAGGAATTVFIGMMESVKGALDRLKNGQAVPLTDMQGRISEVVTPGAQSWLLFAPPAGSLAALPAMAGAGPNGDGNPMSAPLNAMARMTALGFSMTATETLALRLQGSFASPADATTVREFLENMAISALKMGAASKMPKVPHALDVLRTEQVPGTSVAGLSTQVDMTDLDMLPPDALRMFY